MTFRSLNALSPSLTGATKEEAKKIIEEDLKSILTGLARHLFGDVEMRWREDYFPFTEPSFELDIFFNGDWMEVLGCGVIHDEVMANAGELKCDCSEYCKILRHWTYLSEDCEESGD